MICLFFLYLINIFVRFYQIVVHFNQTSALSEKLQCSICFLHFSHTALLLQHKLIKHRHVQRSNLTKISTLINALTAVDEENEETFYSTDSDCDYTIITKTQIQRKPRIKIKVEANQDDDIEFSNEHINGNVNVDCKSVKVEMNTDILNYVNEIEQVPLDEEKKNLNDDNTTLKCDICGYATNQKTILSKHFKMCHTKSCKETPPQLDYKRPKLKVNVCGACGKTYGAIQSLNKHMKEVHNIMKGKGTKQNALLCNLCGKEFNKSANLSKHLRQHSGVKRFTCEICSKQFCHKQNLKDHIINHTGKKPYSCPFEGCTKKFAHVGASQSHFNYIHTKIKPFVCTHCQKGFTTKSRLA